MGDYRNRFLNFNTTLFRPVIIQQGSMNFHTFGCNNIIPVFYNNRFGRFSQFSLEPIIIKDRNNIITAKCMEIHRPLLYNYWAEECSITVKEPISVVLDRRLLDELELIKTGQIQKKAENTNNSFATNEREEQICEGLDIMFGIEIKSEIDKAEGMLTKNDMKIEVTLDTEGSQIGEGFSKFGKT